MSTCKWKPTAARGVYKTTCRPDGVLGVPPSPNSACPHCHKPALVARHSGGTATMQDYLRWKAAR